MQGVGAVGSQNPAFTTYLKASDATGFPELGSTVAVSGDTAVVGTRLTQQMSPSAYVFVYDGTTWQEQAKLDAGGAVGISGDTIVVGDQVFVRNGTTWLFQSQLIASNADTNDFFGRSVAISGDTIVVGAVLEDGSSQAINGVSHQNSTDAGAAYVFVRTGVTWSQEAYLKGSDVIAGDWFGYSVAVEDDAVLVGAPEKTVASRDAAGKSYVFVRNGSVWTEQATLVAPAGVFSGRFGLDVDISGDSLAVAGDDAQGGYVFTRVVEH